MVTLSRRPSPRLLFYCKLDVKNDALINLADNLKTKGLPPRYFAPSIPTPFAPLSRIKIQDAKLPINEGWATAEAKASTGRWRTDSQRTRRVITLKNYPSSEFHRSVSTRSLHRVSSSFHSFLISSVCANSQELMKRKNETLEWENKNMTTEQFDSVSYGRTLKKSKNINSNMWRSEIIWSEIDYRNKNISYHFLFFFFSWSDLNACSDIISDLFRTLKLKSLY